MRIFCWILILMLLFALGCKSASKPRFTEEEIKNIPLVEKENLPEASGGFVLSVAGETLTSNEVVAPLVESYKELAQARTLEDFKTQALPGVKISVVNKVANILLYKEAKKELGDQADDMLEKAVKTETRKFIVSFNGDYSKAGETVYDHPFQFGSKRTGPDLAREGVKSLPNYKPNSWHYNHMLDPQKMNAESIMPPYPWIIENTLDVSNLASKIRVMQKLGVPYPEGYDEKALDDLKKQAHTIGEDLRSGGIQVDDNKEIIALIAYLQRLGTDIYNTNQLSSNN